MDLSDRVGLGLGVVVAGALAWTAACVPAACDAPTFASLGLIAVGFVLAVVGHLKDRARVVAAGLLLATVSMAAFYVVVGGGPTLGRVAATLFLLGLVVSAAGLLRGSGARVLRWGMGLAALGAFIWVPADALAGFHIFQPGNVLVAVGAALVARHGDRARWSGARRAAAA